MAQDKLQILIDLDAKEALQKIGEFSGAMNALGKEKSLDGLLSSLEGMAGKLAILTTAMAALGIAFNAAMSAERIEKANKLFDSMADSVGIVASKLREDLSKASDGFIAKTAQIDLANKAMIQLGFSAAKLPEIIELAKKASSAFGGTVEENAQKIVKAIAGAETGELKNMGIVVQADKAMQAYARTTGVAINSLSTVGKQQAILNAVLQEGSRAFKNVDTSSKGLNAGMQTLTSAWQDLTSAFNEVIGSKLGSFFSGLIQKTAELTKGFNQLFGKPKSTIEFSNAISGVQKEIVDLDKKIADLESKGFKGGDSGGLLSKIFGAPEIDRIKKQKAEAIKELEDLSAKAQAIQSKSGPEAKSKAAPSGIDLDIARQNQSKFESDILALTQARLQAQTQAAQDYKTQAQLLSEQRVNIEAQSAARIKQINDDLNLTRAQKSELITQTAILSEAQMAAFDQQNSLARLATIQQVTDATINANTARMTMLQSEADFNSILNQNKLLGEQDLQTQIALIRANGVLDADQKAKQIENAEAQAGARRIQMERQVTEEKKKALDNLVKAEGVSAAVSAKGYTAQMTGIKATFTDGYAIMGSASQSFANNATSAFQKVGEGSMSMGQAMKSAILGAIADEAIAKGSFLLLSSIFPPNPIGLAAGAGLVALGGALKSASGGKSSLSPSSASVTAGEASVQADRYQTEKKPDVQDVPKEEVKEQELKRRSVQLVVQGNLYETDQTRQRLMDLIRQETDATDFRYTQVGA